nr:CD276 antigen-like [Paramormyrops kingsleyae]XP_023673150.1 CD276 antigen-like [Paramormyrops kingsleyae]XP_023673152.1 CD276 antigen-like [Paramormyrops kingsleyae]
MSAMGLLTFLIPTLLGLQTCAGFQVQVPELPVVALFGQDATLNCSYGPSGTSSLSELTVFWQLTDSRRVVHGFWGGRDQLAEQGQAFTNRTRLFHAELGSGNASLQLRAVRVADSAGFTCFVRLGMYNSGSMLLQVAAPFSRPVVDLQSGLNLRPGSLVSLACMAHGGFPEAEMQWLDGRGHTLNDNVTTSQVANEEGLFSVHSVLRVVLEPNSNYSCRLRNPLLRQEAHASVTMTAQGPAFPLVALWATVSLAVCLVGLLVALAVICRRKIKESCEEARAAAEGDPEEAESKSAMVPANS